MTAQEMIEILSKVDPETPVCHITSGIYEAIRHIKLQGPITVRKQSPINDYTVKGRGADPREVILIELTQDKI